MKTCKDVNIALYYNCRQGHPQFCAIKTYKLLFHYYDETDMGKMVRKHIKDIIYIRAAMELYYPDRLNEIEKYCGLV